MLFCGSRSKYRDGELHVSANNVDLDQDLDQVDSVKYLGIELDSHLSFNNHIDKLCKKVKSRACILWRMRSFISESLAKELYTSLIHPMETSFMMHAPKRARPNFRHIKIWHYVQLKMWNLDSPLNTCMIKQVFPGLMLRGWNDVVWRPLKRFIICLPKMLTICSLLLNHIETRDRLLLPLLKQQSTERNLVTITCPIGVRCIGVPCQDL